MLSRRYERLRSINELLEQLNGDLGLIIELLWRFQNDSLLLNLTWHSRRCKKSTWKFAEVVRESFHDDFRNICIQLRAFRTKRTLSRPRTAFRNDVKIFRKKINFVEQTLMLLTWNLLEARKKDTNSLKALGKRDVRKIGEVFELQEVLKAMKISKCSFVKTELLEQLELLANSKPILKELLNALRACRMAWNFPRAFKSGKSFWQSF